MLQLYIMMPIVFLIANFNIANRQTKFTTHGMNTQCASKQPTQHKLTRIGHDIKSLLLNLATFLLFMLLSTGNLT